MKKINFLILSTVIIFLSPSLFGQTSALEELLNQKSEIIEKSEQNSESLKRLNDEKKILIDKLVDVNKQYDEIMKTQKQNEQLTPAALSTNEIAKYIANKRIGRCKITPGEYLGEYIIQKDKVYIRFAFLPKDSVQSPKLSLVKGEPNEDLLQIEQPGYDPKATNLKGDIHAILRFKINANGKPGEFTHAVFMGQRLYDKWLGQISSLALTNVTCIL